MGRQSSVQNVVDSLSERIFPGLSRIQQQELSPFSSQAGLVYDVKSSLILQMALYFNISFFPVWLIIIVASFISKYNCLGWFAYLMLGCGILTLIVVEVTRLYLGVSGNLGEQAAELSTFWSASLILQLPLMIIIFIIALSMHQILEVLALSVSGVMLSIQLSVSFQVLRSITRNQPLWK